MTSFNETQPIFVQIRQRIADDDPERNRQRGRSAAVGALASPPICRVNPLTVTRAYDALVDLGVVESRRGMGMFVADGGARKTARP